VSIGALLLDPPPYLETAKVFDMLLAVPKYGRVKATKTLHSCRVSPSKTFGGLSERQRAELAGVPGPVLFEGSPPACQVAVIACIAS
jgi:hypothetical protein